nr:uncharacterized protein LOC108350772 isoform X1 [Rattus norvegicus]|eukprot:XP_017448541.1 PREDICTED: uncharacterized protein LOC108350772 isoform X1 [Rattus norvegicus]
MSTCCLIWVVNFIELGDTQEIGMSSKVLLETIGVWLSKLKGRSLFWRAEGTHLNSLTTANKHYKQVAIFHYLLLHPLRPPDNYWSPSGDDVSVSFSFGNGWVDRCNTLKEQLYRSLENVPAAANTNGQTKDRISLCSPDFPGTHRDVSACLSPSAQVLINHPALVGNSTFSDFKS